MNDNYKKKSFSLSDKCRAACTVTPTADRRKRRACLLWLLFIFISAATVGHIGGAVVGSGTLLTGLIIWRSFWIKANSRRILWKMPFSEKHEAFLLRRIPHYRSLDESGRELFRQRAKLFLNEVVFHGAGAKVTDGLRLRAAAAAVTPTLGFEEWEWPTLKEVIFRPDGYKHGAYEDEDGVVTEYEESGMVGVPGDMSGTMMLSSRDLIWEFAHPEEGSNVGFHEFAHLMVLQGLTLAEQDREDWQGLMQEEAVRIRQNKSLLDEYAILNENEFFAVTSELFFTAPLRFRNWHIRLYNVLARCYRSDPAAWLNSNEPAPDSPPRRRKRKRKTAEKQP